MNDRDWETLWNEIGPRALGWLYDENGDQLRPSQRAQFIRIRCAKAGYR